MNISKSQTRSRFFFDVPDIKSQIAEAGLFKDPAAVPMLQTVKESLSAQGFDVTDPRPGKACHASCTVRFPRLHVALVLLVQRSEGLIHFQLLTWPYQRLSQRMLHQRLQPPGDCDEWTKVCAAIGEILHRDLKLTSFMSTTFREGEEADSWR